MRTLLKTVVVWLAAVFLSACSGASITTTPAPLPATADNAELATAVAAALTGTAQPAVISTPTPGGRATLPPGWTPTFTATAEPPTGTPTPITPTVTPTITPTLSEATICAQFSVTTNLIGAAPSLKFLGGRDQVTLYTTAAAAGTLIRFSAVHHWTGENRMAELPGGQANILTLPVRNLPGTGQYDWRLGVQNGEDEICLYEGSFIVTRPESTRADEDEIR